MKEHNASDNLAVLIDADNVPSKIIGGLLAEVANLGTASVRRIYGDWTSPHMNSWRQCLLEHSTVPIQQFAYTTGKNATDGAMIIDAMDLMYTGRFSCFCLVSSDSDFTRLAARIREQGISVHGFGNRHNTHRSFIAACNKFVYLDALPPPTDGKEDSGITPPAQTMTRLSLNSAAEPFSPASMRKQDSDEPKILGNSRDLAGASPEPPQALRSAPVPTRPLDQFAINALKQAIVSSSDYEGDYANLAKVGAYLGKVVISMLEITDTRAWRILSSRLGLLNLR